MRLLDLTKAAGLASALTVLAAAAQDAPAQSPGVAARAKALAQQRCAARHGVDGNTTRDPGTPKLAGQLRPFLALQLANYKTGERPHPVMGPVAAGLSAAEIADLATWYASRTPMRSNAPPTPLAAVGEVIFKQGKAGAPACQWCHGAQGRGVAPVFARLAGQHAAFVVASIQPYRQLDDFKNPYAFVMKAVVTNLDDADLDAVAAYVETLK